MSIKVIVTNVPGTGFLDAQEIDAAKELARLYAIEGRLCRGDIFERVYKSGPWLRPEDLGVAYRLVVLGEVTQEQLECWGCADLGEES